MKLHHLFFSPYLLLVFGSLCKTSTAQGAGSAIVSQRFVPLPLGDSLSRSDLFRGFKLNVERGESPFKAHVFEGDVEIRSDKRGFVQSRVMSNQEDVKAILGVDGRLSVSYGPVSGSGAGRYLDSQVSSKYSASVRYKSLHTAIAEAVVVSTIQPHPNTVLLDQADLANLYGTNFVDSIIYGAQLDVTYTITSTEEIDMEEIEAELQGRIGVGALSVGFKAKFQRQEGQERASLSIRIDVAYSGVTGFAVPSNPTFDQTNQLIDSFNEKYQALVDRLSSLENIDDEANALNQLSPIGFTLSSIADHETKLDFYTAALLDTRMADLQTTFIDTLFWKARLQKSLSDIEEIYGEDPRTRAEQYAPYEEEVLQVIGYLDDKLDECFEYRRSPIEYIVTKGIDAVPIPYVMGNNEIEIRALIGEAFIPAPLEIEGGVFPGIHYIGFGLATYISNNLYILPWLRGETRRNEGNALVARADTSVALAEATDLRLNLPEGAVAYEDYLVLQVYTEEENVGIRRWLYSDIENNAAVISVDDSYTDTVSYYMFQMQTEYQALQRSFEEPTCVKYGDVVYLKSVAVDGKWMSGPDSGVYLGDFLAEAFPRRKYYEWQVRSAIPINGRRSWKDLKRGECLNYDDEIYLQNNGMDYRWLTGGRGGGNFDVHSRNVQGTEYEQQASHSYSWKIVPAESFAANL